MPPPLGLALLLCAACTADPLPARGAFADQQLGTDAAADGLAAVDGAATDASAADADAAPDSATAADAAEVADMTDAVDADAGTDTAVPDTADADAPAAVDAAAEVTGVADAAAEVTAGADADATDALELADAASDAVAAPDGDAVTVAADATADVDAGADVAVDPCAGIVCDDKNPCTNDSCEPLSGTCQFLNNDAVCDDNNACWGGDVCAEGLCAGSVALNCADGNACTDDSCDPSSGCVHATNAAPCSDGSSCTVNDHCAGGSCTGGAFACGANMLCAEPGGTCSCDKQWVQIAVDGVAMCAPDYPVWGIRPLSPTALFVVNADGTVTDTQLARQWQAGFSAMMHGDTAQAYCDSLTLAGHTDWRLPTQAELETLVDYAKNMPATVPGFGMTYADYFWSASSVPFLASNAWILAFSDGNASYFGATQMYYRVRCVRATGG